MTDISIPRPDGAAEGDLTLPAIRHDEADDDAAQVARLAAKLKQIKSSKKRRFGRLTPS